MKSRFLCVSAVVSMGLALLQGRADAQCGPSRGDFVITVVDASDPALNPIVPLPSVSVTMISNSGADECESGSFEIEFSVDDAVSLGALQFAVDYSRAGGEFVGLGNDVDCRSPLSAGGAFATFTDEDATKNLNFAAVALAGFTGPTIVANCEFAASGGPFPTTTTLSPPFPTTTLNGPQLCNCNVTTSVTSADTLGSLQFDTDYNRDPGGGSFEGSGAGVNCTALAGDFTAFFDIDASRTLSTATISTGGFAGPIDVTECNYQTSNAALAPANFAISVTDASAPDFTPLTPTVEISAVNCVCKGIPSTTIEIPRCGDGKVDFGEECDDGNVSNEDSCLNSCENARCGDEFVWRGVEDCDDGNRSNRDACLNSCAGASCGDGFRYDGVEECDDGNHANRDACLNTCVAATCGDGVKWRDVEECDDGNRSNKDACLNSCMTASCGDGFEWEDVEECDDGNTNNDDKCYNDCLKNLCGDGVVQADREECDDLNGSNRDSCLNTCQRASCGDGFVWDGVEKCDAAGESARCDTDCTRSRCGDALTNITAGEECDNGDVVICGDANNDQGVSAPDAQIALNTAVDLADCSLGRCDVNDSGVVTAQDALAILNAAVGLPIDLSCPPAEDDDLINAENGACLDNCAAARCGDGLIHEDVEDCDDAGETATCDANCTTARCGDGDVNRTAGERCDDGNRSNRDACLNTCKRGKCGDGFTREDVEDCDDGNKLNTDACLNTCEDASCGDGFLHDGVETCDDGNFDYSDACVRNCQVAQCGDGFTWEDVEECDDGDNSNSDDCLNDCTEASCGDGFVNENNEQCDDGNSSNRDACLSSCRDARCGDGFVQRGIEQCDGSALSGANCESRGYDDGDLDCFGDCQYDERYCISSDRWTGTWESRVGEDRGGLTGDLDTDSFGFEGTMEVEGSFCIAQGMVYGDFVGENQVDAYADFEFGADMELRGLVDGNCMRGTYEIYDGPCDGDEGVWEICR